MGLTLNGGYGGGSGSYPTLEVTITNGTAASVTATLGSTVVNLTYDSGVWRGTLKAFGTWTVEASNGEKTVSDTVDVTNVAVYTTSLQFSPLPSGYTELQYLESSGNGNGSGQYVNVGVLASDTLCFDIECSASNSPEPAGILFTGVSGTGGSGYGLTFYQNKMVVEPTSPAYSSSDFATKKKYSLTTTGLYVDDEYVSARGSLSAFSTKGISLFAATWSNRTYYYGCSCKIYHCNFTNNNALVRNLYPARRDSDSVLGMYDTVNGVFYTNAGSGTFIAGPEV